MKVCIPIEFKPQGGGFYFLKSFEEYLQGIGWPVTREIEKECGVLFTNHWMTPAKVVASAVRLNPKIVVVHRIDGAAEDYGRDSEADRRQAAVNKFADLTIFQSQYSRYSTRKKFRIIQKDGPVVYNPVDIKVFKPEGPKAFVLPGVNLACISWSTNPLKGAAKIYEVARNNPGVNIHLCGNYPDAPDLPNVRKHGVLERADLAATLRACDALLTFSENEACPNHVIEALASGLPVLYTDSGAMKELVGECGFPVTVSGISEIINLVVAQKSLLSRMAYQRSRLFTPNTIFSRYLREISIAKQNQRFKLGRWLISQYSR